MAYFPWREEYQVNIAAIDAQHRRLVDLLNQLYDAMREGKGKIITGQVLDDLVEYTKMHFSTEEKMMQEQAYPEFLEHLGEHTQLAGKVIEYQQQFAAGRIVSVQLSIFLKNWLINHIQVMDKKYSPYLISRGIK